MKTQKRMKVLLSIGAIVIAATGCGMNNSSRTTSITEPPTTVTANRPALSDNSAATATEPGHVTYDQGASVKTPFSQNENQQDIDTTADIRKRIVNTDLSSKAHNIMITTESGRVSLRGRVESEQEKDAIEKIAREVAGDEKVDSQLEVLTK